MPSWPSKKIPKALPALRKWLRDLRACALQGRIIAGFNYDITETPEGTMLEIDTGTGGGAAGGADQLFEVSIVDDGTLGFTLSQIGSATPDGADLSADPPITLAVDGNGCFFAKVTYDKTDGSISERVIAAGAGTEAPADDDTHAYGLLGVFNTVDGKLTADNTAYGPVNIQSCQLPYTEDNPYKLTLFPSGTIPPA